MITGTYNLVANPSKWKNFANQTVYLDCDTSGGAVTINLCQIAALLGFYNVRVIVSDKTGNAGTNNITINTFAGDTIDGGTTSAVLSSNGDAIEFEVANVTTWLAHSGSSSGGSSVLQSFIVVDSSYGNDATAQVNNAAKPFQTIDAAIAAASFGNLIVINPGTYPSFSNVLQKSLSYNIKKGATLALFGGGTCSAAGQSFAFFGEGDMVMNGNLTLDTAFDGSFLIDVNTLQFNAYIYIDNSTYYAAATAPTVVTLKARTAINNTILAAIYPGIVSLNVDFGTYTSSITAGTADFWCFGSGSGTFAINSYINISSATLTPAINPSPFLRLVSGNTNNNTFVTGTYSYSNIGFAASRPTLINLDSTTQNVFFNGVAYLTNASMLLDQGSGRANFKGKIFNTNDAISTTLLFNCFNVGGSKVEIHSDVICNSALNAVIAFGGSGQLDILGGCEIVNTNGAPAQATLVISGTGTTRLNAKILNAVASISAPAPKEVQAYYLLTNTAPVNITNVIAGTAIITDALITSNNF